MRWAYLVIVTTLVASCQTATPKPDPVQYSAQFWPFHTVASGAQVSKITEYGLLSCVGGDQRKGRPRMCYWGMIWRALIRVEHNLRLAAVMLVTEAGGPGHRAGFLISVWRI